MNKHIKLSVFSTNEHTNSPATLSVTISPSLAKRIKQLARESKRLKVTYISMFESSPTWGGKNDKDTENDWDWNISIGNCMLVVSDTDFHWIGSIKYSSELKSETYPINKL